MEKLKDILDLTVGFVLSQKQALEYLKACAGDVWAQAVKGETSVEDSRDIMEDIAAMAHRIYSENWEWILFQECQMSASGINIRKVVEE